MVSIKVGIKQSREAKKFALPAYETEHSVGLDLRSVENVELLSGCRALVSTGIFIELPPGFEAQIRPRSGLAIKYGVTVLNSPGTIDSDYRGEIKVILVNHGENAHTIKVGDRIAQMVVAQVTRIEWCELDSLSETERGSGGFGSTGAR
jgi:dUTP pyrophosphatase